MTYVTFGFLILESKRFQLLLCYGCKLVNRILAMILPEGCFQAVTDANVIFFYSKKKRKEKETKAYIDRGDEVTRLKPTSVISIGWC